MTRRSGSRKGAGRRGSRGKARGRYRVRERSRRACRRCTQGLVLALGAACLVPWPAAATNAINLVSFGAESSTMGGADVAFVRDTASLAINPAGLSRVEGRQFQFALDPYYLVDVRHSDSLGNDARNKPRLSGFFSGAYAQRLNESLVAGVGLYVAGGLGFRYEDLASGYGTRGDIVTRFGVLRLAPGFAWKLGDRLSLGAALAVNYAAAHQKFFSDSSVFDPLDATPLAPLELGTGSLFGSRIDDMSGLGVGVNLGLQYTVADGLTLGLTWRNRTKLDLEQGTLTVNYESLGAGRIAYRDVKFSGVSIPQDVQLGLLYAPAESWLLSVEWNWIDWSRAIRQFRVEAADPERNPLPLLIPSEIVQLQAVELRDQHAISLGVMFQLDEKTSLRAGYNYARQPVPRRNLAPLIAAIPEKHYALGLGRALSANWNLDLGLFYNAPVSIRYANPESPITENARERHETLSLLMTFSRSW